MQADTACIDVGTATNYQEGLAKIINEIGSTKQEIFQCTRNSLLLKEEAKIFIAKDRSQHLAFNLQRDRLTVLWEANAASDFTLKPMFVCHSENPRCLKNYATSTMPVLYKGNNNNN